MVDILVAPSFLSTEGFEAVTAGTIVPDFTRFDAYVDELGVLYETGEQRRLGATVPLQPPRTDTGLTPFEQRPEFGFPFAQGDFSGGADQKYFHRDAADKTRFFRSEGFNISDSAKITHLNQTLEDGAFSDPHSLVTYNALPFMADGNNVQRGNGSFPNSWTSEDPHAGEGATAVLDLAPGGDFLYAALGVNGIHRRTTGGAWSHYVTGTATTKVAWLKDRLFAVDTRSIYEITAAGALPTAIETLADGWAFEEIWEAGPFVMATAVNTNLALSRIHTYGLNTAGTAIIKKTSTPLPKGDIAYSGIGYLGRVFIGGGRQTTTGGLDAILYEGIPSAEGDLALALIADSRSASEDLSVRCFESIPKAVLFGWSRNDYTRTGLGVFHLARNAFAHHLSQSLAASDRVTSVLLYKNTVMFTVKSQGVFFERTAVPVTQAYLITSLGDWSSTSFKTWDLFEMRHDALGLSQSVELQYSIADHDREEWQSAIISSTLGATGAEARVLELVSPQLSVKVISNASATLGPTFRSFSVRSVPSPSNTEWRLVRRIRVFDKDQRDSRAEPISQDPRETLNQLRETAHKWVVLTEPSATWIALVEDVAEYEPASPPVYETYGSQEREAYIVELRMVGRRS